MSGQDAPHHVFVDWDAERQSNLLSDSRAAPEGIALFGRKVQQLKPGIVRARQH